MRKLAAGVSAAFAVLFMTLLQPWDRLDCDPATCEMYGSWDVSAFIYALQLALYLWFPLIVVTIIQVAVLGVRDAGRPHELAVRAALGETQGRAIGAAARRGLRDGLIWVGPVYVLAAVTHVVILLASGWPLGTETDLWWPRTVVGVLAIGTLVLASVIDAARPRRTPTERLYEDARPVTVTRRARRLGIALGALAAAASGVVIGLALAYDLAPSVYVTNAAGIAQIVAVIALMALALAVLIPAARVRVPALLAGVGGRMHGPAAAIVTARAGSVSRASGRLVIALGSFGFLLGAASSANPAPELSPTYVGYRVFYADIDAEAFANELRAVDGVAGVVTPAAKEGLDTNGNPGTLFAVDPAELTGLDDRLAEVLADHPTAIATQLWAGTADLHHGGQSGWGFDVTGIVPLGTCCELFTNAASGMPGDPDVTAFLIYSQDPALNAQIAEDAWNLQPADLPAGLGEGSNITGNVSSSFAADLLSIGILAALLAVPMIALTVGVVRSRRRDDATLAALGSTFADLRRAVVIETVAVAGFATAVGLALGGATRLVITVLSRARGSLTGVITDSFLATSLGSVAWMALAATLLATIAVVTVSAWVAASARRGSTPVEGLQSDYARGNS